MPIANSFRVEATKEKLDNESQLEKKERTAKRIIPVIKRPLTRRVCFLIVQV